VARRSFVEFHNFWGTISPSTSAAWVAGSLPNEGAAGPSPYYGNSNVQIGDFAYVTTANTFYVCTVAGTAAGGGATWVQITTGAATIDRFAPKYLVGNIANGDSPTAYSLNGFQYIPDPGDGTGIQTALGAAAAVHGDVWIRPGTYDLSLNPGAVVCPMVVPPGVLVQGAGGGETASGGGATTIKSQAGPFSQEIFTLGAGCSVLNMNLQANGTSEYTSGDPYALLKITGGGCILDGVTFDLFTQDVTVGLRYAVLVDTVGVSALPIGSFENLYVRADGQTTPENTPTSCIKLNEGQVSFRSVTCFGGDVGFEVDNQNPDPAAGGCVLFGQDVYCVNWTTSGIWYHQTGRAAAQGAVRIATGIFVGTGKTGTSAARLQGGTHVLRNNVLYLAEYGVLVDPPSGLNATAQIIGCLINDFGGTTSSVGVQLAFGSGGPVINTPVTDCEITTQAAGILVENTGSTGISLSGNSITTGLITGSDPIKITDADVVSARGNTITQTDLASVTSAISAFGAEHFTVVDNLIASDGLNGISTDAASTRATVTGNDVTLTLASSASCYEIAGDRSVVANNIGRYLGATSGQVAPGVSVSSDYCTVLGNTIEMVVGETSQPAFRILGDRNACSTNVGGVDTSPVASIEVSGDNNTVGFNVCNTTPPVTNTGAGNEVAHNI
jgi:hypothetical protein